MSQLLTIEQIDSVKEKAVAQQWQGHNFDCETIELICVAAKAHLEKMTRENSRRAVLVVALSALLRRYLALANSGDAGNWDPEKETEVIASRAALNQGVAGWVVGNANGDKYRAWEIMGPEWVPEIDKALRFARKEDAEAFCRDDEDAWRIIPVRVDGP